MATGRVGQGRPASGLNRKLKTDPLEVQSLPDNVE